MTSLKLFFSVLVAFFLFVDGRFVKRNVEKRAMIYKGAIKWDKGVVPYEFGIDLNEQEMGNWSAAIAAWQRETCITFRPREPSDQNWIRVVNGNRCFSLVGRKDVAGSQDFILAPLCRMYGVIMHELGHALGLLHEHNRPDRDEHIRVDGSKTFNRKENPNHVLLYETPFDLQSIMHYGLNEFPPGMNPSLVDQSKAGTYGYVYYRDLSFFDVRAINIHYGCNGACEEKKTCPGHAFQNKSCACEGPEDYADKRCVNLKSEAYCNDRFDKGHCNLFKVDMRHHCRKTCNTCFKHAGHGVHIRKKACKDNNPSCDGWAKIGECERNAVYMKNTCPKACRECTPEATTTRIPMVTTSSPARACVNVESDRNCTRWRIRGRCQNFRFRSRMMRDCYRACSGCQPSNVPRTTPRPCVNNNTDTNCLYWTREGYCQEHQYEEWMHQQCYRSCGYCVPPTTTVTTTLSTIPPPGACVDRDAQCSAWKTRGECTRNSRWMMRNCRLSCSRCAESGEQVPNWRPACTDNDAGCPQWARSGECDANPNWMRPNCRKSCGVCTAPTQRVPCEDSHENCRYWATIGECSRNSGFMNQSCRRSCNLCPCRDEATSCPINASYCRLIYHFQACQKTCESCMVCKDKRPDCPNLAATAYCRYGTAIRECPVSCGIC